MKNTLKSGSSAFYFIHDDDDDDDEIMMIVCRCIQLAPPGDTSGEDLPPCELPTFDVKDRGPVMPVPRGIRPTLSRHRIEVRTAFRSRFER